MKKEHKKFETWAMPRLKRLQKILLLEHFHPLTMKFGCDSKEAMAECSCSYPYQTISIRYAQSLVDDFKKKKYEWVISILAHEMTHPLTDPLYDKATKRWVTKSEVEDEREKLTDHIANIVLKNGLI